MTAPPTAATGRTLKRVAKKKAVRKKVAGGRTSASPGDGPAVSRTGRPSSPTAVDPQELRQRWRRARAIISEAVEQEDEHDPRIWERGAYQLWLWLVIELLVVRRDDIDVQDLSLISKMLHEQRKLSLEEVKRHQKAAEAGNGGPAPTKLPERFGDLVRQIYGTNFQDDCAASGSGADRSPS